MNCPLCGNGELRPTTKARAFQREGTTLVVKDVPVHQCDQCGDTYYDPDITEQCRLMLNDAVERGEEVVITSFQARAVA